MIGIVSGADVPLRLMQHEVARAGLLHEGIAVILYLVLGQKFEGGVSNNIAIHGYAAAADFTPGNSPADAELLSDKLIKSHEVLFACKECRSRTKVRKKEAIVNLSV